MNVLAESNFVLEIALRQSEAEYALRILALAERGELNRRLEDHLRQISRSSDFADIMVRSTDVMLALASKSDSRGDGVPGDACR